MWDIIGHRRAIENLDRAIAAGHVPHALLLTGPASVGKTRLAVQLASAMNCTGDNPPCGECLHCRQIAAGSHPDVTVVERPEGKDSIRIEQVRELRDAASLRPFQGRRKVYIVAGAEGLTAQAADALLKTLEEPQPQVMIVLTASDPDALPGTIVSRCRVLPLGPVEREAIEGALQERGVAPETAGRVARLAQGRPGWALEATRAPKVLQQQEEMIERLSAVPGMGLDDRLQLAEVLAADKKDRSGVRRNLELLLLLLRDLLLVSEGLEPRLATDARESLQRAARAYTLADIHAALRAVRLAMQRIDSNVDARLTFEALLTSLP